MYRFHLRKQTPEWRAAQPAFGVCARCQRRFAPDWNETLQMFSRCCSCCQVKNLEDWLGVKLSVEMFKGAKTALATP